MHLSKVLFIFATTYPCLCIDTINFPMAIAGFLQLVLYYLFRGCIYCTYKIELLIFRLNLQRMYKPSKNSVGQYYGSGTLPIKLIKCFSR